MLFRSATGVSVEWDRQRAGREALLDDGTPIPEALVQSIRRNRVALKGPLATQVGEGFRSVNVALRKTFDDFAGSHAYDLAIKISGESFLTPPGHLSTVVSGAVKAVLGVTPELSTTGGTSDARFMAQICPQVIEFGPPNDSIHQVNEFVRLSDIEVLKDIYLNVLHRLHRMASKPHAA